MKYIQPEVKKSPITCPHCGAISNQDWFGKIWDNIGLPKGQEYPIYIGRCQSCRKYSVWINKTMYYPDTGNSPTPNQDMPEEVKKLYLEAAAICLKSPRGGAALLRLSIQVLMKELGEEGKNINKDIGSLVKKGLPAIVQQSLDIVRVTGNDAVHPGQIDTDSKETVEKLFKLVNIIIEYMISLPGQVTKLYNSLPEDKIKGIKKRDKQ